MRILVAHCFSVNTYVTNSCTARNLLFHHCESKEQIPFWMSTLLSCEKWIAGKAKNELFIQKIKCLKASMNLRLKLFWMKQKMHQRIHSKISSKFDKKIASKNKQFWHHCDWFGAYNGGSFAQYWGFDAQEHQKNVQVWQHLNQRGPCVVTKDPGWLCIRCSFWDSDSTICFCFSWQFLALSN